MKKSLTLLVGGVMLPLLAIAAGVTTPPEGVRYENGVYAIKISPNGKWIGSMAGDASIYNVETGENIYYDENFLGIGNVMSNDGMAAADTHDAGALLYQGKTIHPKVLAEKLFCDVNAITPDGTRIAGIINSTGRGVTYLPFVADIDENGEIIKLYDIPYPTEDFFRATPQYSSIVWMSNDGKTCMGQMMDWRGMYTVPIFYQEAEDGTWSYSLPTQELFNPNEIDLPDNPWLAEPELPEPEDLMTPVMREAFQNAYEGWLASGCVGEMPDYTAYMTQEQYDAYKEAVETYNEWYYSVEDKIKEYVPIYQRILRTTPSFSANDACLAPSGEYFLIPGGVENEDGEQMSGLWKFYTDGVTPAEQITMPLRSLYPIQILTDGTAILTLPMMATPDSYVMLPGTTEIIHMNDYLRPDYPELVEWIEENFPYGNGYMLMSDDKSIITGALTPGQYASPDENDYYYHTYIVGAPTIDNNGVESLVATPADGIYKVYDLRGVQILETKDPLLLNSLPKGIYIINGKKVAVM